MFKIFRKSGEAEQVKLPAPPQPSKPRINSDSENMFLGQDELQYVRKLRKEEKLDQVEELLLKAEKSPAVLDELRKVASTRAKAAKKDGDWKAIVQYLEGYTAYANQWRDHCIKMVNQEPPSHTESDSKLLQEAKERLAS